MIFYTGESSVSDPQILRVYKNLNANSVINGQTLLNSQFPADSLVFENSYTKKEMIDLQRDINLTGVNNILVFLKKRTVINEIQFY